MYTIFAVFFGLLGVCIGSFLNVVVLRHNTGLGLSRERSICFSCGRQLSWFDNIPLVSFLFLRGKCRTCKSKISLQYPLVELLTGLLFLGLWFFFVDVDAFVFSYTLPTLILFGRILYYDLILSILIVILVYDIKHKIIPDMFVYSFAIFSLAGLIVMSWGNFDTYFWMNAAAGPLFFLPFWLLWTVSDGKWIGLGDGKLALGIGWFLGLVYGLSAIVLAFWIGAVVSLGLIGLGKLSSRFSSQMNLKSEIPFAPFLILGIIIEFFWMIDVIGVSLLL